MNLKSLTIEINGSFYWRLALAMAAICLVMISAESAFATGTSASAGDDVIGGTLCKIANNLTGNIARAIATFAIFAVGVGLFMGRMQWATAAATAAGVAIVFGAPQLVAWVSGDSDNKCATGS